MDMRLYGAAQSAIYADGASISNFIHVAPSLSPVSLEIATSMTAVNFYGCNFYQASEACVKVVNAASGLIGVKFDGCWIEDFLHAFKFDNNSGAISGQEFKVVDSTFISTNANGRLVYVKNNNNANRLKLSKFEWVGNRSWMEANPAYLFEVSLGATPEGDSYIQMRITRNEFSKGPATAVVLSDTGRTRIIYEDNRTPSGSTPPLSGSGFVAGIDRSGDYQALSNKVRGTLVLPTDAGFSVEGEMRWDSTTKSIKVYDGTSWRTVNVT
jgi:hypothetical protein